MSSSDEELERFLDALAHGGAPPPDGVDGETQRTTERLYLISSRVSPPPSFVDALEESLMKSRSIAAERASRSCLRSIFPRRSRADDERPVRGSRRATRIAIAAMMVVMLGAGVATWSRPGSTPEAPVGAIVPAAPSGYPPASDCAVSESALAAQNAARTPLAVNASLPGGVPYIIRNAPDQPGLLVYLFPDSALPAGAAPDLSIQTAIEQAVRREVACRNAGIGVWPSVLASFHNLATPTAASATPSTGVSTAEIDPIPVPEIARMSVTSDGKVFVLLSSDLYGVGLKSWIIFGRYDSDWLADRFGQSASDAWIASGYFGPIAESPVIHLNDTYLWPTEFKVWANQPPAGTTIILPAINLRVINDGKRERTFSMPEIGVEATLQPGAQLVVPLSVAPAGYWYTEDFDPASQTQNGGYLWAIDRSAEPSEARP